MENNNGLTKSYLSTGSNNASNFVDSKLGICGFNNIGNTCYMNSILQLLIHSKLIVNFVFSKSNPFIEIDPNTIPNDKTLIEMRYDAYFVKYLKESIVEKIIEREKQKHTHMNTYMNTYTGVNANDEHVIISKSELEYSMTNSLIYQLAELVNKIIYKGNGYVSPNDFKRIIDKKIPSLRGMGQQDCHELLNGLFDNIIEETGIDSEPVINNVPQCIKNYIDFKNEFAQIIRSNVSHDVKRLKIQELNQYKKNNHSTINKFNGLSYMTTVFKERRKSSLNTSSTGHNDMIFNLLSFSVDTLKCVECGYENCVYQYHTNLMLPIHPTLHECFKHMGVEEIVDRKCDVCNCKKSYKTTKLWRPGMTLFIELCRFMVMPNGRICKNNAQVEIPHHIDITEFCDSSMGLDTSPIKYKYKLKGISNHMGGMGGGHYTADCVSITDNKTWYHFDDSRVSRYDGNNIDTSSAYVLLYEME